MAKFLFVYHGGGVPQSKEAQAKAMDQWGKWFGEMGSAVVDGGNPVGKSSTVQSDGKVDGNGGSNPTSGYSIVQASNLEAALNLAKGCPILAGNGSVEVAEVIDM